MYVSSSSSLGSLASPTCKARAHFVVVRRAVCNKDNRQDDVEPVADERPNALLPDVHCPDLINDKHVA